MEVEIKLPVAWLAPELEIPSPGQSKCLGLFVVAGLGDVFDRIKE